MDRQVLESCYDYLSDSQYIIEEDFKEDHLKGSITVTEDGDKYKVQKENLFFSVKYVFSLLLKNGYKAIYLSVGKEYFSRDSAVFHKVYESWIVTEFVQSLSVTFSSCDPL